jgi:hypothetical protein
MNGPLMDAKQAGELLRVLHTWVLAEGRADRIPHVRLGRYERALIEAASAPPSGLNPGSISPDLSNLRAPERRSRAQAHPT